MNGHIQAAAEQLALEHVASVEPDVPSAYIAAIEQQYLDALTAAAQSVEPMALCEFTGAAA